MVTSRRGTFHPTPFGKYLLVERIGAGGMAEIFRGKTFGTAGFEKEYAIKRILPNLGADAEFVEMFVNEAKLVVDMYHPNIVQVFDLGEIEGNLFIVMEFVDGKDLLDLLARCAENDLKIPLKLTLFIMMEMLKGLDFAHKATDRRGEQLNIIHRDVSPSNIMLSYPGHVKIGDFGVAKARTQTKLTEAGTLKGKVGYMSPEQVRGEAIDHRSDLFAAGIIMYETLTMTRLFMGGNDLDVMLRIRDSDLSEEFRRCSRVPPSLMAVLRKALAKQPADRYHTGEEFHSDIQDFVYHHDIKTSSQALAEFLKRVFKEEIEAENARRLEDTKCPSFMSPDAHAAEPYMRVREPLGSGDRYSGLRRMVARAPHSGARSITPSARPKEPMYLYKGPFGREYGPLCLDELKDFLSKRMANKRERISVDHGQWLAVEDYPELWDVERPGEEQFTSVATLTGVEALPLRDEATGKVVALGPGTEGPVNEGASPQHSGVLGRVTLTRLLFRLVRARCTGKFQIEHGRDHKEVFFKRGEPIVVTSTLSEELLGNFLLRKKVISEDQLGMALQQVSEYGGRLGDALVGARILSTHDLFRYLGEQIEDRVLHLFAWTSGEWAWFPDSQPPYQAVPLGVDPYETIIEGVRHHLSQEAVRTHFEERERLPMELVGGPLQLHDLPLLPEEAQFAHELRDGLTPLEVVNYASEMGFGEQLVWRILYMLIELEVFLLGEPVDEFGLPG